MRIEPSSLDRWTAQAIGTPQLTREGIRAYQIAAIGRVLAYARRQSPFYRTWLAQTPDVQNFRDFEQLPVLHAQQIVADGARMLCVDAESICRIVTSGTTAAPKRLYFTLAELERTVDYFEVGARAFLHAGETALLLFDCKSENGAAQLFMRALERMRVRAIPYGIPKNGREAFEAIRACRPSTVLVSPGLTRAMLACPDAGCFDTLLVSGGALSAEERMQMSARFGCAVFEQYGLTETAFGLGVDCRAFAGYHLRETAYYVEILDEKGAALPDGEPGRVVITSLTCGAMPLIRYDTGDISRYVPGNCPCGSALPLLDRVKPRAVPKGYFSALFPGQIRL